MHSRVRRLASRTAFVIARAFVLAALTGGLPASVAAQSRASPPNRLYGLDAPFAVADLPPSRLRADLEQLPPGALGRALAALNRVSFPAADVNSLRVDRSGAPYYEDNFGQHGSTGATSGPAVPNSAPGVSGDPVATAELALAGIDANTVFQMHSRPGASRVVYLNFRGLQISGTAWNAGRRPVYYARPYSSDADYGSFTLQESQEMAQIWKRVAEDYAQFDIDVTTEQPAAFGPDVGQVLITKSKDELGYYVYCDSCGGVAFLDVWGAADFAYYQPALVFYDMLGDVSYVAEASSHELGHNLGLTHDGGPQYWDGALSEYYWGHGSGLTSWAPIMGASYYANVTQWSKGEYAGANNPQDDLAIISSRLTYLADDHNSSAVLSAATPLVPVAGTVTATSPVTEFPSSGAARNRNNKGVVNNDADVDAFVLDTDASGTIDLSVKPDWRDAFTDDYWDGSNLDVRARLLRSDGSVVVESNPPGSTDARVTAGVPAGRYYLEVSGVGVGSPATPYPNTTGYTKYASVGQYFISGSAPAAAQTLAFGLASVAVNEDAGNVTIPVVRTGSSAGRVSVRYATANGTASAGTDYTARNGTLTFAEGVTTAVITVPIANDALNEGNETFLVGLSDPSGALLGVSSATVTIQENQAPPSLQFAAATYSIGEGAGSVTVTVTRTANTQGSVAVNYATTNGTAAAGSDYAARTGTLTFASGITSQTITVPITSDTVYEGNQTFWVKLSSPVGAVLGTPSSAKVTIADDDPAPSVQFETASYGIGEAGGTVTITVTRTVDTSSAVSVKYATANGSALAGADYTATSGTLSFAPGVTSRTIVVPVTSDDLYEPNETFVVKLSGPAGAVVGTPGTATVTIVDDDPVQNLQFGAATYSAGEGSGNVTLTVTRTGSTAGTISVSYATANGTAAAGSDYTATSGTLSFAAGVTSQTITVPITSDTDYEGNQTFTVKLSSPAGAALPAPSTATVTIVEDDPAPTLQFAAATYSLAEEGGSVTLTVTRTNNALGAVSVRFATANGKALAGSDYTATSGTLNFASGVTSQTITVPITGDGVYDPGETFAVKLSKPVGAVLGTPLSTTVTIIDNDPAPTLQFGSAAYSAGEAGGSVSVTVTRTNNALGAVSVKYATANGSAVAGSDYAATSGTLSFGAGITSQTIALPVTDDTSHESDETFVVKLSVPVGAVLGAPASTTVTIQDNDAAP